MFSDVVFSTIRTDLPCSIPAWFPHAEPGRQLWENPFVKLTVLHGHRQHLSMKGLLSYYVPYQSKHAKFFLVRSFERILLTQAFIKHTHNPCFYVYYASLQNALNTHLFYLSSRRTVFCSRAVPCWDNVGSSTFSWDASCNTALNEQKSFQ